MEFERSLFRVYDRILWALTLDEPAEQPGAGRRARAARACAPRPVCRGVQWTAGIAALIFAVFTAVLSTAHVGSAGCLGAALSAMAAAQGGNTSVNSLVGEEDIVAVMLTDDAIYVPLPGPGIPGGEEAAPTAWVPAPPAGVAFAASYIFSATAALVALPAESAAAHRYVTHNVTLPYVCDRSRLPGAPSSGLDALLGVLVSYDTVMVNSAMYTWPGRAGYLYSAASGEVWNWGEGGVAALETSLRRPTQAGYGVSAWLRVAWLLEALIAFALASAVCALLVRVILLCGSAGLYLGLLLATCCTLTGPFSDTSVVDAFYPWLGVHVAALRRDGPRAAVKTLATLVWAQLFTVLVMLLMQQGAAQLLGAAFYSYKSTPNGMPSVVYLCMTALEYFSMVFVRAKASVRWFPRYVLAYYLLWAAYFHATVYGFNMLALETFALACTHLCFAFLLTAEVPALRSGAVGPDRPRALLMQLPGPDLPWAFPQLWTLFHPVNAAPADVYDADVPPLQTTGQGGSGAAEMAAERRGGAGTGDRVDPDADAHAESVAVAIAMPQALGAPLLLQEQRQAAPQPTATAAGSPSMRRGGSSAAAAQRVGLLNEFAAQRPADTGAVGGISAAAPAAVALGADGARRSPGGSGDLRDRHRHVDRSAVVAREPASNPP
jgi:hypothetical protein